MALNLSLVQNINPGNADGLSTVMAPGFTNLFGELYFSANNGTTGFELFKYNPNAGEGVDPVTLAADINGGGDSDPADLTGLNGLLYFAATDDGTTGRELYTYDP
ncbi:MAG: hypothetical protein QNJ37_13295, partial [Crocosphaera sp.]|nr:hypothetical protein [Crocosphaera sp.]